ncbi:DNA replication/repair protein RecF [Amnibacterium setariae]|uniref:DNA replication and repair protein RecF n=1 Tax=Amnibacterium setariae TaxID=2306585 RepID=A0A3A1U4W3_9MICO|nr:DNA replication/repair protein RecF [Amnibacterium setariae]RIX30078.1 DNA replication/repair protein RecF [Amnibacterium setariae]
MRIANLRLTDWRNYAAADVSFAPGANVLAGSNGQGKTNLVEAIGFLTTLGSHRVAGDAALVRAGADAAVIRATVVAGEREVLAEVLVNRVGANRAQLNRSAVRPREITRNVSSVLFAPEDLAIVRGEPSARRRFVDELLVQRAPRLAGTVSDYEKALRQRNGLLRGSRGLVDVESLAVWDERLVATGSELLDARTALLADLEPLIAEQYAVVAGADQRVAVAAQRTIDDESDEGTTVERFTAALARVRRREIERGITLVGPHRDDVLLTINGLPARGYASHGESWSLALALRLGSVELLRHALETGDPIVILDDVFAELDERRRVRLADRVARYEQVIVTAAVEADIPPALAGRVTRIRAGSVVDEPEPEPAADGPAGAAERAGSTA